MSVNKSLPGSVIRTRSAGDPLQIQASEWNAIAKVVNRYMSTNDDGRTGPRDFRSPCEVPCKNVANEDLGFPAIVEIVGLVFDPSENVEGWKHRFYVKVAAPSEPQHNSRFAITQQPMADGKFGFVATSGLSPAVVRIDNRAHEYAEPIDGDTTKLKSARGGPFKLVYVEDSGGSGGGSGSGEPGQVGVDEKCIVALLGSDEKVFCAVADENGIPARVGDKLGEGFAFLQDTVSSTAKDWKPNGASQKERVYNVSESEISPDKWIIAWQDYFNRWLCAPLDPSGHVVIQFRVLRLSPYTDENSSPCQAVVAEVIAVSCNGSGVAVGDEVTVYDPYACWFSVPIEILEGSVGQAVLMKRDGSGSSSGSGQIGVCQDAIAQNNGSGSGSSSSSSSSCWWLVQHLCCTEELYAQ